MDIENHGEICTIFAVVRQTSTPSVLTENLLIDTKVDAVKLKDSKKLDKIAQVHTDGIVEYKLGNKGKEKPSKSKNKKSGAKPKLKTQLTKIVDLTVREKLTKALQYVLNTPVDGIISRQLKNNVINNLYGGV